jgi:ubiquinone/menaquinone biosynthesis C-methylase UbiE
MSIRGAFDAFYKKVQPVIAPGVQYSQAHYEQALHAHVGQGKDWMDLGCGHTLLPPWRAEQERQLVARARRLTGLDYDFAALRQNRVIHHRVRGDVSKLPFTDNAFDLVTANMVFEHLQEPQRQMAEIFRVLKPGGTLIFHTPNKYGYGVLTAKLVPEPLKKVLTSILQGRKAEDVYPTYYRVNSASTIGELAARTGFRVKEIDLIMSSATLVMIPPLVILELLWMRLLMTDSLRSLRTNIIAVLQKPVR